MLEPPPGYINPEHQGQDLELLQLANQQAAQSASSPAAINVIFDAPPGPESGRFIEVETDSGLSIRAGEWLQRQDGNWALRITSLPSRLNCVREVSSNPAPLPTYKDMKNLIDKRLDYGLPMSDELRLTAKLQLWEQMAPKPAPLPTEENISDLADEMLGIVLPEGAGVRLITRALELWGAASTSAQPAAIAQPAEADQLTLKEVEAQECFTALRDEILNLNDGLEVNEVLHVIDNHTPEWV
jgi:hypothetical protein